jgi:hypothetical protein
MVVAENPKLFVDKFLSTEYYVESELFSSSHLSHVETQIQKCFVIKFACLMTMEEWQTAVE